MQSHLRSFLAKYYFSIARTPPSIDGTGKQQGRSKKKKKKDAPSLLFLLLIFAPILKIPFQHPLLLLEGGNEADKENSALREVCMRCMKEITYKSIAKMIVSVWHLQTFKICLHKLNVGHV